MADFEKTVSTPKSLKKKIAAGKSTVNKKYANCKRLAKKLVSSRNALIAAEAKKESTRTPRAFANLAVAENRHSAAIKEYKSFLSLYDSLVDDVLKLYDELVMIENAKGAKKARIEAEKYDTHQGVLKEELWQIVKDVDISEPDKAVKEADKAPVKEDFISDKKEQEEPLQPKTPPQMKQQVPPPHANYNYSSAPSYFVPPEYMYRPYHPQGVSIAPVSIDISSVVEDAVASAMEKFKIAFDKRAGAFCDRLPVTQTEGGQVISEKVMAMEENVAENEQYIIEKLTGLTENLKNLSDEITELGVAYLQLANKQKDAAELQRRINDMQRALSRELQGVQANQKVINQDQADVSAEQASVMEHQKANVENQKLITDSQDSLANMQKAVIETQTALEESMRDVLRSQKDIIAAQQSVINSNTKNIELQRELAEKQSEVTNLQKTVVSEYKQVTRAQRNVNGKAKPRKSEKRENESSKTLAEEASTILEQVGNSSVTDDISQDNIVSKYSVDREEDRATLAAHSEAEASVTEEVFEKKPEPSEEAKVAEEISLEELNAEDEFRP